VGEYGIVTGELVEALLVGLGVVAYLAALVALALAFPLVYLGLIPVSAWALWRWDRAFWRGAGR
jgi:membrane protein YdbS with pleckstrin-like domain